jgi:hypothetical protein
LLKLREALHAGRPTREHTPGRLRARIRQLNPSQLGAALAARAADARPSSRELSPELVLVDPALAAWARASA